MKNPGGSGNDRGGGAGRERAMWRRYIDDVRALVGGPHARRNGSGGADEGSRELVEAHLLYVVTIAREYSSFGIPMDDLLSEGNVGLLEAASRFDPDRGAQFSTYASWWIRKRILNLIARQLTVIRLPKYKLERLRTLRAAEAAVAARLGRAPTVEDLAAETGLPAAEIESLRVIGQREISLEYVVHQDSGRTLGEGVTSSTGPAGAPAVEAEDEMIEQDFESFIGRVLDTLPEKERFVVRHRYGFEGNRAETLQDIADRMGMSREGVRQIEMSALARIRKFLDGKTSLPAAPRPSHPPEKI